MLVEQFTIDDEGNANVTIKTSQTSLYEAVEKFPGGDAKSYIHQEMYRTLGGEILSFVPVIQDGNFFVHYEDSEKIDPTGTYVTFEMTVNLRFKPNLLAFQLGLVKF